MSIPETRQNKIDIASNTTAIGLKTNQIDFTALLQDTPISPEQFIGNDFQKLQEAIALAISEQRSIQLSRMYDITGSGVLLIDKGQGYSPNTNRKPFYLKGIGGGIRKDDAGYIFSASLVDVGEIFAENVRFQSVEGAGCTVWDGNNLINLFSSECHYVNCDGIMEANTRYGQGWNFFHNVIVGGKGWAFSFKYCWAVFIDNNIIEWRENGICNTGTINEPNQCLRIAGNTIEGLTGLAISINGSSALQLRGNYFEANAGGHVIIKSPCLGMEMSNNFYEMNASQLANGTPAVSLPSGLFSSRGNRCNGVMYNMIAETTLYSENDWSPNTSIAVGDISELYTNKKDGEAVTFNGGVIKKYGASTFYENNVSPTLTSLEKRVIDIVMPGNIYDDDHISVRVSNVPAPQEIRLLNFSRLNITTVRVVVENTFTESLAIVIHATVLRLGNSSYYG